ncbi:MAG: hypothetical protein ACTS27_08470 [Phycisphaerales bacterium]
MRQTLLRLAPVLRLTRVTTAFAAVGNVWFVILWTRAAAPHEAQRTVATAESLWALLPAGALTAVSLYAFGASLNDILDVRRDRLLHPTRPLSSGRLTLDSAVMVVALTLVSAGFGAFILGPGAVLLTLLTACAMLLYHAVAKFIPSGGAVLLSLIYALHMFIPNPDLRFVWPIWLVMTHALVISLLTHRLSGKRPRLTPVSIGLAIAGWAFWSSLLLLVGWWRNGLFPEWIAPTTFIGPLILAGLFAAFATLKVRTASSPASAADKLVRYGALWLTIYNTAWLMGAGEVGAALTLAGLALAGIVGMSILRELYSFVEHPLTYRL